MGRPGWTGVVRAFGQEQKQEQPQEQEQPQAQIPFGNDKGAVCPVVVCSGGWLATVGVGWQRVGRVASWVVSGGDVGGRDGSGRHGSVGAYWMPR